MSKSVRKIIGMAAPLAGLIPGVGLPLAIALGAGGGLLSGGGLKGALIGGLGGGLTGGGAGLIGNAVNSGLDLGLTGAQAAGVGGAALGAGAGGLKGGLKGALTGGALGGAGTYFGNGGASELFGGTQAGNMLGLTNPQEGSAVGNLIGSGAGADSTLAGLDASNVDMASPSAAGSTFMKSSGVVGANAPVSAGGGASSFGTAGGNPLTGGSGLNLGATLLGGLNSMSATDQAKKALEASQNSAMGVLQPYLASGTGANTKLADELGTSGNTGAAGYGTLGQPFTPGDLTQDPGYQFNLTQGNQALDRRLAASGNLDSGAALKEGEQFGQGLADNTYNNAFSRYMTGQGQRYGMLSGQAGAGQGAAAAAGNIFTGVGNAKANAGIAGSNILNGTLASILTGSGAKRPVNVGGQVFYL